MYIYIRKIDWFIDGMGHSHYYFNSQFNANSHKMLLVVCSLFTGRTPYTLQPSIA